jgi:hypothetical protein
MIPGMGSIVSSAAGIFNIVLMGLGIVVACITLFVFYRKYNQIRNYYFSISSGSNIYLAVAGSGRVQPTTAVQSSNIMTENGFLSEAHAQPSAKWRTSTGTLGFVRTGDIIPVDIREVMRFQKIEQMEDISDEIIRFVQAPDPEKEIVGYVNATCQDNTEEERQDKIEHLKKHTWDVYHQLENMDLEDGYVWIPAYHTDTSVTAESVHLLREKIAHMLKDNTINYYLYAAAILLGGTVFGVVILHSVMG